MKRLLILLLALAMLAGLAACGEVKQAEVVENVEPVNDTIVIETPPAMVNGPEAPANTYLPVSILPTTAPSATPVPITTPEPILAPTPTPTPSPTPAPGGQTAPDGGTPQQKPVEYADDSGKDYNPTATQEEKNNAVWGYINANMVNFRVGPGGEYKIYESLPKGTRLKILGTANAEWVKVWYNDYLIGYVAGKYISVGVPNQDATVITPSPSPGSTASPEPDSGSDAVIITP